MHISFKLILKAMAMLAITALPLVTSAQKQVKQILFNTNSYDIYGDNDHEYVTVLYTDCTYGRVPISDVKISGLGLEKLYGRICGREIAVQGIAYQ